MQSVIHAPVSGLHIAQRIGGIDDRAGDAARQKRQHMLFDGAGEPGLHLNGAGAQRRAGPGQSLDQQGPCFERDLGPLLIGNLRDAPIDGDHIKIALHIRAPTISTTTSGPLPPVASRAASTKSPVL